MKGITILLLVLLAGCATYTPLEQLEAEAFATGDWSLVEQRERMISWQNARRGANCPDRMFSLCETGLGETRCQCVSTASFRSSFAEY
jgi:hypothetical protein